MSSIKGGSQLTVKDNILSSGSFNIQISNISYINVTHKPYPEFRLWYLMTFFIGVYLFISPFGRGFDIKGMGFFFILPLIIYGTLYKLAEKEWGLLLHLNSGEIIIFYNKDKYFLTQVNEEILKYIIKRTKNTIINNTEINNIKTDGIHINFDSNSIETINIKNGE